MTRRRRARPARRAPRGFTIAELLVTMVVALIVVSSLVRIMVTQARGYGKQNAILDVRDTDRGTTALLTWELRHASIGGGNLVAINPDSVTLRSVQAVGVVCAKHPTLPRFALWRTSGSFTSTADDSALVYRWTANKWHVVKIAQIGTPAALGIAACAWPGARPPDFVVEVAVATALDTSSILVGAPFRQFRKVQYAEYQANGRWWLGRRTGTAAGYEQVTGPLTSPANRGLKFVYYDVLGAATAVPANVATVAITVRGQSTRQALNGVGRAGVPAYQVDSVVTKVTLRR